MTKKMDHSGPDGDGNTKLSPSDRKRLGQSKYWCFTLNNYTEIELDLIIVACKNENYKYVIGKEIGEKGTPHLQGYISCEKRIRANEKFKNKRIHWEICKGSEEDNYVYCTKGGDFITNIKKNRQLKLIKKEEMYKWQQDIIKLVKEEPDDRTIYWFWEEIGNVGKTSLVKYLMYHHNAVLIEGKKNDILYCAAQYDSDIYVIDLSRTDYDFAPYNSIEKIKNGAYMCAKYESKPIIRNNPHIIIFANSPPDTDKLSKDRWVIKELTEEDK